MIYYLAIKPTVCVYKIKCEYQIWSIRLLKKICLFISQSLHCYLLGFDSQNKKPKSFENKTKHLLVIEWQQIFICILWK